MEKPSEQDQVTNDFEYWEKNFTYCTFWQFLSIGFSMQKAETVFLDNWKKLSTFVNWLIEVLIKEWCPVVLVEMSFSNKKNHYLSDLAFWICLRSVELSGTFSSE